MEVTYGKLVIIGAGKVGDAVLNSALRMNARCEPHDGL